MTVDWKKQQSAGTTPKTAKSNINTNTLHQKIQ
jgi:hypothetical protein